MTDDAPRPRVTGIGGVFFKSADPAALKAWYRDRLGVTPSPDGYVGFEWLDAADPSRRGYTVWEVFPSTTEYFDPSASPFMVNFRVNDLDGMLAQLRAAGCRVDDRIEEMDGIGRFGWVMDPDGNRVELWEPAAG